MSYSRSRYSLPHFVGYHGCDQTLGENVLAGKDKLKASDNSHDWLGPGIYFWQDSPERAWDWAKEHSQKSDSKIKTPFVLGAFIYPGLCLNLTDTGLSKELTFAYKELKRLHKTSKEPLPQNKARENRIVMSRNRDCAVIKLLHKMRKANGDASYDSVYGFFEEGKKLYRGSALKEKTHVQIAVINTECILGYFRPGRL